MDNHSAYKMIGLMSGTSGDGLDIAYCEFTVEEVWSYNLIKSETVPFPPSLAESLALAHRFAGEELAYLDVLFGKWMGQAVREFCKKNNFEPNAIASHGHTVFHQPEKGLTLQIGNGWAIHQFSGFPVINDFRSLDVVLGGQGAPLVPIGDRHLFGEYGFCLNLGGIANISMESDGGRKAMDITPFNLLLNLYAEKRGLPYDDQGRLAERGSTILPLLHELDHLPRYTQAPQKSLAREDIDSLYKPLLNKYQGSPEDFLSTLTAHFSTQITDVVLSPLQAPANHTLLVTGGGAYNSYFISLLKKKCGEMVEVMLPKPEIIDFKEALIFAFLGVLRLRNENNCLGSATGAIKDNCGGTTFGLEGMS